MQYVIENGYAVGFMDGDRFVAFLTPVRVEMLVD
jgi:hypothetical protein